MVLTNILLGVVIFLLINILGVFHSIDSKIQYGEDIVKLRKLADSLVKGPIIKKVKDR